MTIERTPTGASWESLVAELEWEGLRAVALTTREELIREGNRMIHMVGSWSQYCLQGFSRVFTITEQGRTIATAEIVLRQGAWQVQQVVGHRNTKAPPGTDRIMERVAPGIHPEAPGERMIPIRIIRKHTQEIQGPELDQLLVSLYRASWEHRPGGTDAFLGLNFEQRMQHFHNWLQKKWEQDNPKLDELKVRKIFARELPDLRRTWEEVTGTAGAPDRPGGEDSLARADLATCHACNREIPPESPRHIRRTRELWAHPEGSSRHRSKTLIQCLDCGPIQDPLGEAQQETIPGVPGPAGAGETHGKARS